MCDWECSGVQGDTCGEELSGVDHGVEWSGGGNSRCNADACNY